MRNKVEKWGKVVEYSITNEASWMVVTDGSHSWVYITRRDFGDNALNGIIKETGVRPDFVKKKEMRDLLTHFGVDTEVIQRLFKKDESTKVDV